MSGATFYGAHAHFCEQCGGKPYPCPQVTHCRRPRHHPCPDHDPDLAQAAERLTKPNVDEQIELVRALATERDDLRAALEHAVEWMAEDGCDCGTDEPGTCGLCEARAALEKKP